MRVRQYIELAVNGCDCRECLEAIIRTAEEENSAELATLRAEVESMREALKPSGDTKAAYMGEIMDPSTKLDVSWSAIKMIMRMISDRGAKEALK